MSIPKDEAVNQNQNAIGAQTDYKIIGIEPGAGYNEIDSDCHGRLWVKGLEDS